MVATVTDSLTLLKRIEPENLLILRAFVLTIDTLVDGFWYDSIPSYLLTTDKWIGYGGENVGSHFRYYCGVETCRTQEKRQRPPYMTGSELLAILTQRVTASHSYL